MPCYTPSKWRSYRGHRFCVVGPTGQRCRTATAGENDLFTWCAYSAVSVINRSSVRPSVRLSVPSIDCSSGGRRVCCCGQGRGQQKSIDSCCCRATRGPRKFRSDCKEVQHICHEQNLMLGLMLGFKDRFAVRV